MTGVTLIGGEERGAINPLTLLLGPLSYPEKEANLWDISRERREKLALKKHFLVRGIGWIDSLEVPVNALTLSPLRRDIFNRLPKRGPLWQTFSDEWGFVEGGSADLGVNSISKYLFKNSLDSYLSPKDQDARFFTLFRAVGFIVFLHEFATRWFNEEAYRDERRSAFKNYFGFDYFDGFVFRTAGIEPMIFKVGTLGDAYDEQLMGVAWRADGRRGRVFDRRLLKVKPDFASRFRAEVELPWKDDASTDVDTALVRIFVEERCADLNFMLNVADFSGKYFGTAPLRVRAGSDFYGPLSGILLERFIDIRGPVLEPRDAAITQQRTDSV